jgi:hypothetical protein
VDSRFHQRGDQHYSKRTPQKVRRGVDAPGAKLSAVDRATIRHMCDAPFANHTRIGRLFGVSRQTIWRVRNDA